MCIRDRWRTERTSVEKGGDEVWIAEKFQSNSEIAGSVSYTHLMSISLLENILKERKK